MADSGHCPFGTETGIRGRVGMCSPEPPLHVLQELGAWETAEMVRRYAHHSSEHPAQYVERFSPLRVVGREGVTNQLRSVEGKFG